MLEPRRLAFVTLLAFLAMAAPASRATLGEGPPAPVRLDTGWEIKFDPDEAGRDGGWQSGRWDEDWEDVSVPHVFNPKPIDDQFLGTNAWYRLRLRTPLTPPGFSWQLRFEGVRRDAVVWLNGRRIGSHSGQFEPFTLPADGLRRPGQPNDLVVRVSNIRSEEEREGWWNWGGITRPVVLEPVGRVEWQDLGVLSDVDCEEDAGCRPLVRADGWLVNHTREPVDVELAVRLASPAGDLSQRTFAVADLAPGERRRVGFPVAVEGEPQLWSPVEPNLYAAQATVELDGELQQVEERRVGLRYVRVRDGRLFLNGNELQLRGASIQEDVPGRGPALREEDIETIVGDLEALGANVTRAQYPLDERLLERLDEEGILVWSQAPVYHEDVALQTEEGRRTALDKLRATVLVARNHPSVLTHSVANELSPYADQLPGTRDFLARAAVLARDLDDTVPAALDLLSYPNIPRQEVYDAFGVLGINSYYGWYDGKEGAQSTADFDDLAPFLRSMREKYPRQAQIITEFGAESTFSGPSNVKETFEFQADYVRDHLGVVADMPWLAGAIYWTAREFYVKPDWDGGAERDVPRDALHNKGLITYDGEPKPAFDVAREIFEATPVYR
jgi:beta-galactosidase/beta-glucuronidase